MVCPGAGCPGAHRVPSVRFGGSAVARSTATVATL